ncbi:MAG TPA: DUF167 domain-containing protein [Candidatus Nanoarchaeia archaeon]|nr:DUF167 domain-containing protein [Candidatus Nanoarchaeia archaeon]
MIIKAKVVPNSSEDKIEITQGIYRIKVKAAPVKGKANKAVMEILSSYFNVKENKIKIKNPTSRIKLIEILKD